MENASKALIIAGAILLSILIIALGVFIFNQSRSSLGNIGLSDQEIAAFNSKWESYKGTQIGSSVRGLVTQVNNYNRTANDERYITIKGPDTTYEQKDEDFIAPTTTENAKDNPYNTSNYNPGSSYKVDFNYTKGGLISTIYIDKQ